MLVGIFGGLGSGKTLLLTVFAKKIVENPDYKIYANYEIADKRIKYITPIDLLDINPKEKRALVLLDELYAWLDSRISSSKVNRILSWVILQSRKRNMDICYTAQISGSVDLRMRTLTDIAIICEKEKMGFCYKVYWQKGLNVYNRHFFLPYKNAEKYFPIYNTREVVKPIGFEKLRNELLEGEIDLNLEIENITNQISKKVKSTKITKRFVSDYLIRMGKPLRYADYVYTRLKMRGD